MSDHDIETFAFDTTAFMSGQMRSKLWLAQQIEWVATDQFRSRPIDLWVLGGWYCTLAFILSMREKVRLGQITSIDIDPAATAGALVLNESLALEGKFAAITHDALAVNYAGALPDIIVNSSVEHMPRDWFDRIPDGTMIAMQSNDMPHDDHFFCHDSLDAFAADFPLRETLYRNSRRIRYQDWSFTRFMIIGRK